MSKFLDNVNQSMMLKLQDWLVRYGFIAVTILLFTWFILTE